MDNYINSSGKSLAVIGSRTCTLKKFVYDVLNKNRDRIKIIVSGGANGPDTFAVEWADENGIPYLVFPAKWYTNDGELDRGAGMRRNRHIIKHADTVLAFYDGVSKGTAHSIEMAKQLNKPLKIITFDPATMPQPEKKSKKKETTEETKVETKETSQETPWTNEDTL